MLRRRNGKPLGKQELKTGRKKFKLSDLLPVRTQRTGRSQPRAPRRGEEPSGTSWLFAGPASTGDSSDCGAGSGGDGGSCS